MLARSSTSTETELRNVVKSTAAVIFLGTPHRGSPDVAALGECVRSVVSTLGMDTTPAILDALGLKTTDLERAQEAFSEVWRKHDFRVKTFQEGLGLSGANLSVLGNKVVPDYSSLIGDHREHAETIQANHLEMCRFSGPDDPNYRKIGGELRSIYDSIEQLNAPKAHQSGHTHCRESMLSTASSATAPERVNRHELDEAEKACLQSLWYASINNRHQSLENPAERTCHWLFDHKLYQDWLNGRNREKHGGLLWLKGKPGAGKSILMKEAVRRAALEKARSDYCTAAFFFSAKGDDLERSPVGLFRSLLYQLLPGHPEHLRRFKHDKKLDWGENGAKGAAWQETELESFLESMFTQESAKKTLIFIDALDECDARGVQSQAYFWRRITKSAHASGIHLNVCLSSRWFPGVTVSDCPEIIVDHHNSHDIETYVEQRFNLSIATQEPRWELLRDEILGKSDGVFLWAVLVVDEVLRKWDDGKDLRYLLKHLDVLPKALETLFSQMFRTLSPDSRQLTARLFQWAILTTKPLQVHEWHHIMAFIRQPTPSSLSEWRISDNFTKNDDQLERQIRCVSKGLVEVKRTRADEPQDKAFETMSVFAGAGSLNLEQGETRIVQVIHESVREFFLQSNGFSTLDPSLESNHIGKGHLSVMATCLDYVNITELDALVQARTRAEKQEKVQAGECEPPVANSWWTCSSLAASSVDIPRYQGSTDNKTNRALPTRTFSLHSPDSPCIMRALSPGTRSPRHSAMGGYYETTPLPAGRRKGRSVEEISVFETLKSSDPDPNIDIIRWMATNQSVADSLSLDESARSSTTDISVAGQSQELED